MPAWAFGLSVGSSWGFYAVPDLAAPAARAAGVKAAAIAAASAMVPGPAVDLVPSVADVRKLELRLPG